MNSSPHSSNYYETLCVPTSATQDEIRRAYRVLARRYHPDVNPGKTSEERFKAIAAAYAVLSDPTQRARYDAELGHAQYSKSQGSFKKAPRASPATARARYEETQRRVKESMVRENTSSQEPPTSPSLSPLFSTLKRFISKKRTPSERIPTYKPVTKITIVEISVTIREALIGARKAVEIADSEPPRKISVIIPAGARSGSVIRLRDKRGSGEEVVCIVRVAYHPSISIENKGVIVEIPITVQEAVTGAHIPLPTFEDKIMVKIPPGTQSGTELRVKGKGILNRTGERGDLFFRLIITLPELTTAPGYQEVLRTLDTYYAASPRAQLPATILEMA